MTRKDVHVAVFMIPCLTVVMAPAAFVMTGNVLGAVVLMLLVMAAHAFLAVGVWLIWLAAKIIVDFCAYIFSRLFVPRAH
jgi:hypothetical protein